MNKIPPLLRFTGALAVVWLAGLTLLRAGVWLAFDEPSDPLPAGDLLRAFYLGAKFDLRLVLIILLPLLVLGPWRRLHPLRGAAAAWWRRWLTAAMTVVLFTWFVHYGFYSYLHRPLDATVLRFFDNPLISAGMVWQTYPVVWGTLALVLFAWLHARLVRRLQARLAAAPVPVLRRRTRAAWSAGTAVLVLLGLYGQLAWYPLRWSNAYFSTHYFAAAVTVNPVLHFFDTLKNRRVTFDKAATARHYDTMVEFLGIDEPDRARLDFTRRVDAPPRVPGRPNVVVVILESFAAYKTGLYGNPLDPTPHFDAVAREGIYFDNFFVPQPGTARSVFTFITGIPDPERIRTASRNPLVVEQHTLVADFDGYEKFYFLGGSANWGNIRGVLAANIPGLRIFEEGSYDYPRQDVWGIADHHLFLAADAVLARTRRPFFAIIQTSGNHRPYTIPEDRPGFTLERRDEAELRRYGFQSLAEYNAFRYMDYSIGVLMEAARRSGWYDDTVFVFFGDHGLPGPGEHRRPADAQLGLDALRVPFVIHAPHLLGPGRVEHKVASELDVLPTLAGLILGRYRNTTLGRDLFDPRFDDSRYAFTILNSPNPQLGLIGDGHYFRIRADGSDRHLHRLDSDEPRRDLIDDPRQAVRAARMEELTRAIYETARYMLYNNKGAGGQGLGAGINVAGGRGLAAGISVAGGRGARHGVAGD